MNDSTKQKLFNLKEIWAKKVVSSWDNKVLETFAAEHLVKQVFSDSEVHMESFDTDSMIGEVYNHFQDEEDEKAFYLENGFTEEELDEFLA